MKDKLEKRRANNRGKGGKTKVGQRDVKVESPGNKTDIAKKTRMKEGKRCIEIQSTTPILSKPH